MFTHKHHSCTLKHKHRCIHACTLIYKHIQTHMDIQMQIYTNSGTWSHDVNPTSSLAHTLLCGLTHHLDIARWQPLALASLESHRDASQGSGIFQPQPGFRQQSRPHCSPCSECFPSQALCQIPAQEYFSYREPSLITTSHQQASSLTLTTDKLYVFSLALISLLVCGTTICLPGMWALRDSVLCIS